MAAPNVILSDTLAADTCDFECSQANGGTLVLRTAGDVDLAIFALGTPAFDAAAPGGTAELAGTPLLSAPAVAGGVCTKYVVKTSGGTVLWTGTVGDSGSVNLLMLSTTIVITQVVPLAFLRHNVPTGA